MDEYYWFKKKKFGYGWQPSTQEGWLVTIAFIVFVVCWSTFMVDGAEPDNPLDFFGMFGPLLGAIILFIAVVYRTGEPYNLFGRTDNSKHINN
ncbi:MAG: hypothetical protein Q8Q18_00185 [bacterium]|nr:hypothetical protein [bacterium]